MIAVDWKNWRLDKKYEKNRRQLFNLKSDPKEEHDLAAKYPDIVKQMAAQHTAWSKTLAQPSEISKLRAGNPVIITGHGRAFAWRTKKQ